MRRLGALLMITAAALVLAACAPAGTDPPRETSTLSSALPTASAEPAGFVTGLTIPWAIGGPRETSDGRTVFEKGEWPPFPVPAIRLWDTRTAWLNLEPTDDQWAFAALDAHLAEANANGVDDVLLVLAGTPRWAAQRETPDDAPWLGPGSAAPPTDIAEWKQAVTTIATRYRGQLSYEIGNEPNLATFWNGTIAEHDELVRTAAAAIKEVAPSATVVAGGPLIRRTDDLPAIQEWLGNVAGDPNIDAVSVHVYPSTRQPGDAMDLLLATRAAVAQITDKPVWVTEMNVRNGDQLPPDEQQALVSDLPRAVEAAGFDRGYWYAWTQFLPDGLIPLAPGTPGARALADAATD